MQRWLFKLLLVIVVAAVCGAMALAPRDRNLTLHISTGDHFHLIVGNAHHDARHHDHRHSHRADHDIGDDDHAVVDPCCQPAGHPHDCFDLAPLIGDCKSMPRDATGWLNPGQVVASMSSVAEPGWHSSCVCDTLRWRISTGFTPPDLVGSIILLA